MINTSNYETYLQERSAIKALVKTKTELKNTKQDLASIRNELSEVKELLQQLLKVKEN